MNIQQLYYVLDVKKTLNISKSAKNLFISQPTLSQQIKALENELGKEIFKRNARNLTITKDGEIFCRHAQNIVEEIEEIHRYFQTESKSRYFLDIALNTFYNTLSIDQILEDFLEIMPKVSYNIEILETTKIFERLLKHQLHFAVAKSSPESIPQTLHYEILHKEKLQVVINRQNPDAQGPVFDAKRLSNYKLITAGTDTVMYNECKKLYKELQIPFHLSSYNAMDQNLLLNLVENNRGIFLATGLGQDFLQNKRLAVLPLSVDKYIYTVLLFQENYKSGTIEDIFRQYIIKEFPKRNPSS